MLRALLLAALAVAAPAVAQDERRLTVDATAGEVRVPAEALRVDMPLEFICVVAGTADHEALMRTTIAPSQVHAALLGLGVEPGRPLRYSEAAERWLPPEGPPLRVEVEWAADGGEVRREPVGRLVRDVRTRSEMPQKPFVFVGSRMYALRDGTEGYAADATGQVVSIVNFDSPVIDVGELASNANETLEWEVDPDRMPPAGTPVVMILSPILADAATRPAPPAADASSRIDALREDWEAAVLPRADLLRDAAAAHYALMQAYQDEINRLVDQADALRREKEALQARFDDLTTPQPVRSEP